MIPHNPEEPLHYLTRTFNTFMQQAVCYLNLYSPPSSPLSQSLYDLLMLWIHPQGVVNLIKTITIQHQNDASFPQVIQPESLVPQKRWSVCGKIEEVVEPECTPEKQQKIVKKLVSSRLRQFSEEIYYKQSEEDEESINVKKQEGFQSSYSSSQNKTLYKRGPYKSYTLSEKLRAVNMFAQQKMSMADISKKLGIPCKNIKRWATEGVTRKRGGGRKRTNPELQQEVYRWLIENHPRSETITVQEIQEYALSRAKDPHFKASRGWAIKFIERHHLKEYFIII